MHLLHSDWLIHMLEKSSTIPQQRLLNVFTLLNDWLDAPAVRELDVSFKAEAECRLIAFMSVEAAKAGAEMPEMLANQLYFMALAAAQEKINAHHSLSLVHAQRAAEALIRAQTHRPWLRRPNTMHGIAASIVIGLALLGAGTLYRHATESTASTPVAEHRVAGQPYLQTAKPNANASPAQTAALFAKIEQMRKGDCQLIEALQLPDAYKTVYFENIVSGQISTDPKDQKLVHELLDMVRCNYKPMLMMNSK